MSNVNSVFEGLEIACHTMETARNIAVNIGMHNAVFTLVDMAYDKYDSVLTDEIRNALCSEDLKKVQKYTIRFAEMHMEIVKTHIKVNIF